MSEAALKLRCADFETLTITAASPSTYVKGFLTKVEDTVCVVVDDIAALATGEAVYRAKKILLPKRVGTTAVFAAGDKVYYNGSVNKLDVATTSTYTLCGRALEAAGATATEVLVDFNGACAA
jgi:predicted RecA/RadA family phage recombinase